MSTNFNNNSILAVSSVSGSVDKDSTLNKNFLSAKPDKLGQFGGFESRMLENNYNKSVFGLLFLFSNTLLKFFDGGM